MRLNTWATALLVAAAACGESPTEAAALSDEEAIQEAVFRELMSEAPWPDAAVYCLSVGEWDTRQDPSQSVMQRFRDHSPLVVPGSECTVSAVNGTQYRPTGARGQTFHIATLRRSGDAAEVEAMWQFHGRAAGGYRCEVVRRAQGWAVAECEMTWIA